MQSFWLSSKRFGGFAAKLIFFVMHPSCTHREVSDAAIGVKAQDIETNKVIELAKKVTAYHVHQQEVAGHPDA